MSPCEPRWYIFYFYVGQRVFPSRYHDNDETVCESAKIRESRLAWGSITIVNMIGATRKLILEGGEEQEELRLTSIGVETRWRRKVHDEILAPRRGFPRRRNDASASSVAAVRAPSPSTRPST